MGDGTGWVCCMMDGMHDRRHDGPVVLKRRLWQRGERLMDLLLYVCGRAQEGTMINKSLLTLGTCIRELSTPNRKSHVPYRDSKLTRLLRNALGGNSYTVAVCNITDCMEHVEETTSTLKFASFTSKVINKAVKNEHAATVALLQQYKIEVEELKRQLSEHVDEEVRTCDGPCQAVNASAREHRRALEQKVCEELRILVKSQLLPARFCCFTCSQTRHVGSSVTSTVA
jgi:hypothetical protein